VEYGQYLIERIPRSAAAGLKIRAKRVPFLSPELALGVIPLIFMKVSITASNPKTKIFCLRFGSEEGMDP